MTPQQQQANLIAFSYEQTLVDTVAQFVRFGARPLIIRSILGHRVNLPEIRRIYKILTPIDGRGFYPQLNHIARMDRPKRTLLAELVSEVGECFAANCDISDTILAVWRHHLDRTSLPGCSSVGGATIECLIVLALRLRALPETLVHCAACGTPNLNISDLPRKCTACSVRIGRAFSSRGRPMRRAA